MKNMDSGRDVDDSIIDLGRSLLPYVRMNGHPDLTLDSLAELPWMFILMFELLTSQELADEQKPFGTIWEQANTLQTIFNTLQENLRLPLNHITGTGLATLERRHLADALTIFADLLHHCYPMALTGDRQAQGSNRIAGPAEEHRLTTSMVDISLPGSVSFVNTSTPTLSKFVFENGSKFPNKEIPFNQGINQANVCSNQSPVATVLPVAQVRDNLSNASCTQRNQIKQTGHDIPDKDRRHGQKGQSQPLYPSSCIQTASSTQSSTTLAKEVYKQIQQEPDKPSRTNSLAVEQKNLRKTPSVQVFESAVPSLSLLSPKKPVKKHRQRRTSPCKERTTSETRASRYAPYYSPAKPSDIKDQPKIAEKLMSPAERAKKIANSKSIEKQAPVRVRTTSSCTLVRRPSVKSFKDPGPPKTRRVSVASSNSVFMKERPVINRPCRDQELVENESKGERIKRVSTSASKPRMMSASSRKSVASRTSVSRTGNKELVCSERDVIAQAPGSSDVDIAQQYHADIGRRDSYKDEIGCLTRKDSERGEFHTASKDIYPVGVDLYNKKRRPSVVSTKYRKHSSPISPNIRQQHKKIQTDRTVARGDESPQTISLCSSLKLLKEFEYIRKRLKQISAKKIEHMQALQDLEQEEERLMYVLSHVHKQTGTPSLSNRATIERRNARAEPV